QGDVMPTLPPNPNLDQLRHQAKELLRAAKSGDPEATRRLQDVSERPSTLAVAQLAIARAYGFPSWARLKEEVETRALDLAQKADAFCEASISSRPGRALRLLAETPELATYNFATAVILGDIDRVRELLGRDPGLATRVDPHRLDGAAGRLRIPLASTRARTRRCASLSCRVADRRRRRPDRDNGTQGRLD